MPNKNQEWECANMLEALGFSPWQHVRTRASIADLFKPQRRCGIYVLRFSNGEFYAGQAVDVTRRYVQHRKTHGDIEEIAFKPLPRGRLSEEERALIERLEQEGWQLRNIALVLQPHLAIEGRSSFSVVAAFGSHLVASSPHRPT